MDLHQHHHNTTNPNPNPDPNPVQTEALRLLGISEKLLQTRDLAGSREFALLAQEMDPLLEGSDQILAITDVLLASEKRVVNNRHQDWYSILQTNRHSLSFDHDLLKKNYRRLALLLHPDKNHYPFADSAFKFVSDAWALLSDHSKREFYDHELNVSEVQHHPTSTADKDKLPIRRSNRSGADMDTQSKFWTACPYCYCMYEYPKVYEDCCLRCQNQNCERGYHATVVNSLPPIVPGKEEYYCCWGFFPLGFSLEKGKKFGSDNSGFPNWTPAGMFNTPVAAAAVPRGGGIDISDGGGNNNVSGGSGFRSAPVRVPKPGSKKRGRPRKNP